MEIKYLLEKHFNVVGEFRLLYGEQDDNYFVESANGEKFLLKISSENTDQGEIEFQNALIQWISGSEGFEVTELIPSADGKDYTVVRVEDSTRYIRLFKWIDGKLYSDSRPQNEHLLGSLGESLGYLSKALMGFDHKKAHRYFSWDIANTEWIEEHIDMFNNSEEQECLKYFLDIFNEKKESFKTLRKSVIYNDANDNNIITGIKNGYPYVKGFIDFGDAVYSFSIIELAVCLAYALMGKADPLQASFCIIQKYNKINTLLEDELKVLFSLVAARLMVSVTTSLLNQKKDPDNEYLQISARPAMELLKKLRRIHPDFALYYFRHACGLPVSINSKTLVQAVENGDLMFGKLFRDMDFNNPVWLDSSVGSIQLGNFSDYEDDDKLNRRFFELQEARKDRLILGKYLESRPLYTTDEYMRMGNDGPAWRTVHIGLDIFAEPGTEILCPFDAEVYSLRNNDNKRDYGPTLILKHKFRNIEFYTLYGHLSKSVFDIFREVKEVKQGDLIAHIGRLEENGGWPPHLHFQVIINTFEYWGNYPGVAFPHEKEIWESVCPDPCIFLGIDRPKDETLTIVDILEKRSEMLGKSLSVSYKKPLHIVRGKMQYLMDADGQRYLDMVNNVAHVGHENPVVVKAGQDQMTVLNTNTRYLNEEIVRFSEELLSTFPDELCVCHFVNSGSEANELAIRMAKAATGRAKQLVLEHGYHGNTNACIDISSYKFDGIGGNGTPENTIVLPVPDTFRGKYRGNTKETFGNYINEATEIISKIPELSAFIAESIMSCSGQIELPDGYLMKIYELVRESGGICIADEVQVGLGRVGEKFWGFELHGVIPDIVTIGKPLGNGHPVAAVVTTREIAEAFNNGMEYFNTFGGNPVSCAIGRAVLKEIRDKDLQQNALEVGNYLMSQLRKVQKDHPIIADVRGKGLFCGIELIKGDFIPAAEEASYLVNRMREKNVLLSTDGPDENVIKIKPPMCFTRQDVDFFLENLRGVLMESYLQK